MSDFIQQRRKKKTDENLNIEPLGLMIILYMGILLLLVSLFFADMVSDISLRLLANLTSVLVLIGLILIIRATKRGIWSVPAVYLVIFSFFHFGATLAYGFDFSFSSDIQIALSRWFNEAYVKRALLLAFFGFILCMMGVFTSYLLFGSRSNSTKIKFVDNDYLYNPFAITGLALLTIGILGWFLNTILLGGTGLLVGSYRDYLDFGVNGLVGYLYFLIALGFPILLATPPTKIQYAGILLFFVWVIIAFPLGLRGEVLFPAGAAMVIASRRQLNIPLGRTLLVILTLLILIAVIRELRQVGLREFRVAEITATPIDAIVEMGSTLRPVVEVMKWEELGERMGYGSTYWAPFERLFLRIFPIAPRLPAEQDMRLLNVFIEKRVGPIGFSPIAEAYYNFRTIGVVVWMFLTGLLLGYLDLRSVSIMNQAFLAVIFVPLLIQIRNNFTPIPIQIILGSLIVYITYLIARAQHEKKLFIKQKNSAIIIKR